MSENIAIDGPAGAGKSTIAKKIAKQLGFIYVDTGAMYRAMAIYFLEQGLNASQEEEIKKACENADISIAYENGEQQVLLNGTNVTGQLRTEEVGNMASASSTIPEVRVKLVHLQQILASNADVVMDGRDIGTAVLPAANTKVYLTADAHVRAKRRYLELQEKGIEGNLEAIEADINERDYRDMNRAASPLRQADDAVLVDSSNMSIDEVVDKIISIYEERNN